MAIAQCVPMRRGTTLLLAWSRVVIVAVGWLVLLKIEVCAGGWWAKRVTRELSIIVAELVVGTKHVVGSRTARLGCCSSHVEVRRSASLEVTPRHPL